MFLITTLTILALFPPSNVAAWCVDGFSDTVDDICVKVIENPLTWPEARTYCQDTYAQHNADLAQFVTVEGENNVTLQSIPGNVWIGANDRQNEGTYVWLDNTDETSYTNWGNGQPTNSPNFNCVGLRSSQANGSWSEMYCGLALPFICSYVPSDMETSTKPTTVQETTEMETTTNPASINGTNQCDADWMMLGDIGCIKKVEDQKLTWFEARENCKKQDADLVVVPDTPTQRLIKTWFTPGSGKDRRKFWFGLSQQSDDEPFKWLDDVEKVRDFGKWHHQLNEEQTDEMKKPICGLLLASRSGRWNIAQCNENHFSVCMKNDALNKVLEIAKRALADARAQTTIGTNVQEESQSSDSESIVVEEPEGSSSNSTYGVVIT